MNPQDIDFSKILKKTKSSDMIFLSIVVVFFAIVIILFFYSTHFIMKNINKIFSSTEIQDNQALNVERYSTVVKKLDLPVYDEKSK